MNATELRNNVNAQLASLSNLVTILGHMENVPETKDPEYDYMFVRLNKVTRVNYLQDHCMEMSELETEAWDMMISRYAEHVKQDKMTKEGSK